MVKMIFVMGDEICTLYNIIGHSPLVELLDAQKGYCLLKDLCGLGDKNYTVGVIDDEGLPRIVFENPDEAWVKYDQADEIMRNALKTKTYNKASRDYFGSA